MKKKSVTILGALAVALGSLGFTSCGYPNYHIDHYFHHTKHAPYGNYYHTEHQNEWPSGKGQWRFGRPDGQPTMVELDEPRYPYYKLNNVR
ncbi:MAG: hypothetical protein AAGD22_08945 [Verrucomicrobiota bacterium]